MFIMLWRLIIGYVEFEIIGRFPERFLNLAYSSGINIWKQTPKDGIITARMPIKNYRHIRRIAKKSRVRLKINSKHGIPFLIFEHRDRRGLAIGFALLIILLIILSNFIWVMNIQTSPTVNYSRLKAALSENGVKIGAYKKSIDVLSAERRLMQDVPELSWAAVNIVGTSVSIEIKSKEITPDTDNINRPYNVKAAKDGVIVKTDVKNGTNMITVGSGVTKGQLLVSGVMEYTEGVGRLVHADAQILARTSETCEFFGAKSCYISAPTGNNFFRYRLNLLWLTTPETPALADVSAYFQNVSSYSAQLNDCVLPFGFVKEENMEYLPRNFEFTAQEQKENAYKKMALYEAFHMKNAAIESRKVLEKQTDDGVLLTVSYTCIEDIAVPDPIYTEDSEL